MGFQFSIRTLSIILLLFAVALAAMVSHNRWAVSGVYTAICLLLCVASVGAFVASPDRRRFWIGFTIFGWCYWLAIFYGDGDHAIAASRSRVAFYYGYPRTDSHNAASDRLLTNQLLDFLESRLAMRWAIGDDVSAQYAGGGFYPGVVDDIKDGKYLIRWTDGSSSPSQWTIPTQIANGGPHFRIAGQSLLCALFALLGGVVGMLFCASASSRPLAAK